MMACANVAQLHPEDHETVNAAQIQPIAALTRREGGYDRSSLPQLSDDHWTALIGLINNRKSSETNEKLFGTKEFIIDSGAFHHMTSNLDFLSDVTDIIPCSIRLPDGDRAMAEKQGRLCLGDNLWLSDVIYSP